MNITAYLLSTFLCACMCAYVGIMPVSDKVQ